MFAGNGVHITGGRFTDKEFRYLRNEGKRKKFTLKQVNNATHSIPDAKSGNPYRLVWLIFITGKNNNKGVVVYARDNANSRKSCTG